MEKFINRGGLWSPHKEKNAYLWFIGDPLPFISKSDLWTMGRARAPRNSHRLLCKQQKNKERYAHQFRFSFKNPILKRQAANLAALIKFKCLIFPFCNSEWKMHEKQQENYNNFIATTTNGPTMCGNRMCSDRRMESETWNYDRSADRQMDRPTDRQCSREVLLPTKKNTWVYASLYIELTEYNLYFYGRTGGRI